MTARSPRLAVPAGATDTAIHVYEEAVPPAPGGPALPGHFPAEKYREMQKRVGLSRVIVVQPNAYQFDNEVTLDAIRKLGNAKGVGVVRPDASEAEIERLTRGGIVAQRIFQLPWGAVGFDRVHEVMARVHPFGWFANVQLDGRELPKWEQEIRKLPGRFSIDHTGKFLEPVTVDAPAFKALLGLLDTGRCWVKLAAPYETSRTGAPKYEDVGKLARALVKHAPERILWASNWPHPSEPMERKPDDADMIDLLLDWAPDDATRRKILVDNPAKLYGFGPAGPE
jgi:D-galactarolactone isomerase